MQKKYSINATLWRYQAKGGWYFVTLPKPLSLKIRKSHFTSEEGWGRLKVEANIGKTHWLTAIWFDTKAGSYLLPIKANVRKKESLSEGKKVQITLKITINKQLLRLKKLTGF